MSDFAPSIGSIGKVTYDPRNDRSKGLIRDIVPNGRYLHQMLRGLAREHTHGTRLSVRLVLAKGVDPDVSGLSWGECPLSVEAFVPVYGHPLIGGVASYGANHPDRRPSSETRREENKLYMNVAERLPRPHSDVNVDVLNPGTLTDRDVAELLRLYRSSYTNYLTDFTTDSVQRMTADSLVLVVRNAEGRIVSVCVAEMVQIEFPETLPLRLVQISGAATLVGYRGRGFYSAAKVACVAHLRGDPIPTVIETQARANSGRVLGSNLGRGFARAGYLPMDCVISSTNDEDVSQEGRYGNRIVFYVP